MVLKMITDKVLSGEKIYLRQISMNDCTDRYVEWLNDPEVNQYLETKWSNQNIESIRTFVEAQRKNNHSILFAIIYREKDVHIGNIKIGPVHPYYNHADISYFIGEKGYWRNGLITEAIRLVCQFGFDQLSLHKIAAGVYDCAVGSWRALENCGFKREGILRDEVYFKGKYICIYRYGLLRGDCKIEGNIL